MKQHNKQILTEIKGDLLQIIQQHPSEDEYDNSQMEYLLQLIDCMLLEKFPLCKCTIMSFMEETILTSIYGMNPYILSTLHKVEKLEEEDFGSEIHIWDEQ